MAERLVIRAHAKVNLCLSVGPAVAEGAHKGMHPIASWMAAIDLCDEIELIADGRGDWTIAWADGQPVDWPLSDDLAVRSAGLLGVAGRVSGRVSKSIPAGGGLGGGSSDAAAAMMAMNRLLGLAMPAAELQRLSTTLGSDIAFFIYDGDPGTPPPPALVTGLGDRIERTPRVIGALTLVCPTFGCPTGAVYRTFDGMPGGGAVRTDAVASAARGGLASDSVLFNDLAGPALAVRPELAGIRERVASATGRAVHVSGSGSTLFVLGEVDRGLIESRCAGVRVVHTRFA